MEWELRGIELGINGGNCLFLSRQTTLLLRVVLPGLALCACTLHVKNVSTTVVRII